MLRFYTVEIQFSTVFIQIRSEEMISHGSVKWANRRMSIEGEGGMREGDGGERQRRGGE